MQIVTLDEGMTKLSEWIDVLSESIVALCWFICLIESFKRYP